MDILTELPLLHLQALAMIAADDDEPRYYLRGVYMDPTGYAVATAGTQLLAARIPPFEGEGFIVPREAIAAAVRSVKPRRRGDVVAGLTRSAIVTAGTEHPMTPIDAVYPVWKKVVPTTVSGELAAFDAALLDLLQSAIRLATQNEWLCAVPVMNGRAAAVVPTYDLDLLAIVMPLKDDGFDADDATQMARAFMAPPAAVGGAAVETRSTGG